MKIRLKFKLIVFLLPTIFFAFGCKAPAVDLTTSASVKRFGAKGDGFTNDTKSFELAIRALKDGDINELFLPKGEYLIDSLQIQGIFGGQIRGAGMFSARLIPRIKVRTFIQFGRYDQNERVRLANSVNGLKLSQFRIFDPEKNANVGLRFENCQDNVVEQVEVRGLDVAIEIKQSWLNSFRNVKVVGFRKFGIDLQEKALNANLFETVRASSAGKNGICYRVAGNSTTFLNCSAEGGGIGWDFGYCRMVNLISCHSEHGTPFSISGKAGIINISGHFIWKPDDIWFLKPKGSAESVAMRNCYIYSLEGKMNMAIPGKRVIEEGTLQSKVY